MIGLIGAMLRVLMHLLVLVTPATWFKVVILINSNTLTNKLDSYSICQVAII